MKITCDSKNETWCPYGMKNCECDMYEERKIKEYDDYEYSCTDVDKKDRYCRFILVPENERELKVKKFIDMIASGKSISDIPMEFDWSDMTLQEFMNILSSEEFRLMKFELT